MEEWLCVGKSMQFIIIENTLHNGQSSPTMGAVTNNGFLPTELSQKGDARFRSVIPRQWDFFFGGWGVGAGVGGGGWSGVDVGNIIQVVK